VTYANDQGITDLACEIAADNIASRRVAEDGGFGEPTPYSEPDGQAMVRYTAHGTLLATT
jgi:hypothetical protein